MKPLTLITFSLVAMLVPPGYAGTNDPLRGGVSAMSSVLHRLGRWRFARRRYVLVTWLVVIAALAVVAISIKQPTCRTSTSKAPSSTSRYCSAPEECHL